METKTIAHGEVRPCCTSRQSFTLVAELPRLTHYRCEATLDDGSTCGRNHYVGHAEPLKVGALPRAMGG
jgi:hypothetical protein